MIEIAYRLFKKRAPLLVILSEAKNLKLSPHVQARRFLRFAQNDREKSASLFKAVSLTMLFFDWFSEVWSGNL